MVPGALWVSPARPATSASGAGDLGGVSVVRPAGAVTGGEGVDWRVRGRKWYPLLFGQVSPLPRLWSTWGVDHVPFISVSGAVLLASCSR